jgi:RES domain-containing protein
MHVWRICRSPYAATAYQGVGAARGGGRWNSREVFVAYASQSLALATLEYLVHISREQAPSDLVVVRAELPDNAIETLDLRILPERWQRDPPPLELRQIGDAWIRTRKNLALRVPSAIVPTEWNVLVNPVHPRFSELSIAAPEPFTLDPRFFK